MKNANREMTTQFVNGPLVEKFQAAMLMSQPYLIAVLALATTFTTSGAYNTDTLTSGHRFMLWTIVAGLIVAQATAIDAWVERRAPIGYLATFVAGISSILATNLVVTFEIYGLKFTPLLPKAHDPLPELYLFLFVPVSTIAGTVVLYRRTKQISHSQNFEANAVHSNSNQPFPSEPRASLDNEKTVTRPTTWPLSQILLVKACDHYLEIWTSTDHVFLKGRMKDAVALLKDDNGVQVHRSWWIAETAVKSIRKEGRDWLIQTHLGRPIPIGRGRVSHLKKIGWLVN